MTAPLNLVERETAPKRSLALSISERIWLLNSLPAAKGDRAFLREIISFREGLVFSEEEKKQLGMQQTPTGYRWDQECDKNFDVSAKLAGFLLTSLDAMAVAGDLPEGLLRLLERLEKPD